MNAEADDQAVTDTDTDIDRDSHADPEGDADEAQRATEPVLIATGLGVDGEHGALFTDVDLALSRGFHAIQMPGGPAQDVLLLTLAGRFAPTRGSVSVFGDTTPGAIRRHCAIAAFADIDDLDESVTVQTVARLQPAVDAYSLEARVVVVTGAGNGIGRATALLSGARGASVSVVDKDFSAAEAVAAELSNAGVKAIGLEADVSDEAAVDDVVRRTVSELGPLYGYVNNAGVIVTKPLVETTVDDWELTMQVNARGAFLGSRAAVREFLRTQSPGAIVNVGIDLGDRRPGRPTGILRQQGSGAAAEPADRSRLLSPWNPLQRGKPRIGDHHGP